MIVGTKYFYFSILLIYPINIKPFFAKERHIKKFKLNVLEKIKKNFIFENIKKKYLELVINNLKTKRRKF